MGTPNTGALSARHINSELERSLSAQLAIGSNAVRSLAGVASSPISFNDLRGRAQDDEFTVNSGFHDTATHAEMGYANNYDFGFHAADIGSVGGATVDGASIRALCLVGVKSENVTSLYIILNGSLPQDYFTEVWVEGLGWLSSTEPGVVYEVNNGLTQWQWGTSGNSVPQQAADFDVIFRYH